MSLKLHASKKITYLNITDKHKQIKRKQITNIQNSS